MSWGQGRGGEAQASPGTSSPSPSAKSSLPPPFSVPLRHFRSRTSAFRVFHLMEIGRKPLKLSIAGELKTKPRSRRCGRFTC